MTENFTATPAFDTLKFVKDLTDAGVENTHAHAITESLNKVLLDILKTAADRADVEKRLEDISKTAADRADVEKRLEKLEWKWWKTRLGIALIIGFLSIAGTIMGVLIK